MSTKLKLEMDALRVESFSTAETGAARGTVNAHANGDVAVAEAGVGRQPTKNTLVTDDSYLQTCIFYTCGGCTTADPEYC